MQVMNTDPLEKAGAETLTAVVHRRVQSGRIAEFEEAMQEFIRFAVGFPGHHSITVLRPGGGGRDYVVIDRFRNEAARRAFKTSRQYNQWMDSLGRLTEGDPRIEELTGLEGWFAAPGNGCVRPPKIYKMAIATFVGVFPLSMVLDLTIGRAMHGWPYVVSSAVFNACIVTSLTWVVMPALTRILSRWLFAGQP